MLLRAQGFLNHLVTIGPIQWMDRGPAIAARYGLTHWMG